MNVLVKICTVCTSYHSCKGTKSLQHHSLKLCSSCLQKIRTFQRAGLVSFSSTWDGSFSPILDSNNNCGRQSITTVPATHTRSMTEATKISKVNCFASALHSVDNCFYISWQTVQQYSFSETWSPWGGGSLPTTVPQTAMPVALAVVWYVAASAARLCYIWKTLLTIIYIHIKIQGRVQRYNCFRSVEIFSYVINVLVLNHFLVCCVEHHAPKCLQWRLLK